jgi:cell division transport system permease protein
VEAMRISTIGYTIKQGVRNIWRNKMFSLASIATMSACIFLFGLFFAIVTNFQAMVKEAESGVAVTAFFDENITQEQIDLIGEEIRARAEVSDCKFVSADEAWTGFREQYFGGSEEAAASFAGDNPLANSASYAIYMNDVSMQPVLVDFLKGLDGVRDVRHSATVANTLSDFNSLIGYISVGIILILFLVAIFLISNTVTTGIAVRRDEIGIMKLIGATDSFVRAPFIVEGILIGLIGAILPLALLYLLYNRIVIYIEEKFSFIGSLISFVPAEGVFHTLVPVALALGVGIGFLGSRITIRKHLKV